MAVTCQDWYALCTTKLFSELQTTAFSTTPVLQESSEVSTLQTVEKLNIYPRVHPSNLHTLYIMQTFQTVEKIKTFIHESTLAMLLLLNLHTYTITLQIAEKIRYLSTNRPLFLLMISFSVPFFEI